MGEGFEIVCGNCGFRKEITYGPGFMSSPRNPETRANIIEGKYGKRPKKIVEENPDAECSWYRPLFHCSCGNISAKDSVIISNDGKILYRPSMRCGLCHRNMWEVVEMPCELLCPKCGHEMLFGRTVLWD